MFYACIRLNAKGQPVDWYIATEEPPAGIPCAGGFTDRQDARVAADRLYRELWVKCREAGESG